MGNEISRAVRPLNDLITNSKKIEDLRLWEESAVKSFHGGIITEEEYDGLMREVEKVRLQLFQIDKIKKSIDRGDYDKETEAGIGSHRLTKALDELVKGGHLSDGSAHKIRGYMTERLLSGEEVEAEGLQPSEDLGSVQDDQDD